MSTELKRKGALRDIWAVIVFAASSIIASHATAWNSDDSVHYYNDDPIGSVIYVVGRWFFLNFGLYAGVAALISFGAVVAARVHKGDPIKEDAALLISAVGLIVAILGLLPESARTQLFQSFFGR